ncbi:MAG: hypothetical protein U0457_00435 [Candidatus Sericytochromatia bacterium]
MKGQIIAVFLFILIVLVLNQKVMLQFFQVKRKRLIKNVKEIDTNNRVNIPKLNIARKKRLKNKK